MAYASEEIINALKKGREAKGLSQRALSARTGVPQSHISKIESGQRRYTPFQPDRTGPRP